jgi:hypothetical protein
MTRFVAALNENDLMSFRVFRLIRSEARLDADRPE